MSLISIWKQKLATHHFFFSRTNRVQKCWRWSEVKWKWSDIRKRIPENISALSTFFCLSVFPVPVAIAAALWFCLGLSALDDNASPFAGLLFGVILKCVILFTPLSAWEVSVCLLQSGRQADWLAAYPNCVHNWGGGGGGGGFHPEYNNMVANFAPKIEPPLSFFLLLLTHSVSGDNSEKDRENEFAVRCCCCCYCSWNYWQFGGKRREFPYLAASCPFNVCSLPSSFSSPSSNSSLISPNTLRFLLLLRFPFSILRYSLHWRQQQHQQQLLLVLSVPEIY